MLKPTEEMKKADSELAKEEYMSNQRKSYVFRNRGLEMKIESMGIIFKRLKELDEKVDSQSEEEKLYTLAVMAEMGKAIIPD